MQLHLVDTNVALVEAWRESFASFEEVDIREASILDVASDAVVSPANSHGFMDGGLDLVYLNYFGFGLQERVRNAICRRSESMIPVGAAELVVTGHRDIPFLVVAPTMEMPEAVPSVNARRALAAVLRLWERYDHIGDLWCPGLGTGVGQVLLKKLRGKWRWPKVIG